jgi:hypothetical protein
VVTLLLVRGLFMRSIAFAAILALAVALGVPAATSTAARASAARAATVQTQPSTIPAQQTLFGVTCAAAKFCAALGEEYPAGGGDGGPLAAWWNGKTWTEDYPPSPAPPAPPRAPRRPASGTARPGSWPPPAEAG